MSNIKFKIKNKSGFPIVISFQDIHNKQYEYVIYNAELVNLLEVNSDVIIHNRLYDNALKYQWIKAGYNSIDIGKINKKNSEIYVSEFFIHFDQNENTFIFDKNK